MVATISPFTPIDAPRIAQLINKSNQFNLTTIRRTEGEVNAVAMDKNFAGFTMRLKDRFGDHGLIAVAIGKIEDQDLVVDTWLMSCRVLKRGIEEETLKEVVQQARVHGCERIIGTYRPTEKNGMVRDLYPRLGFAPLSKKDGVHRYILEVARFLPAKTRIELKNI
jgi:FkbH-like protein